MVNMTNRANVDMRFVALKLLLGHGGSPYAIQLTHCNLEPTPGFEPGTSSLPRKCSTPELRGPTTLERVMGIEPTSSAWKAEVLPLNYTRMPAPAIGRGSFYLVEGGGFEPPKAVPADLQSAPVDRLGNPPKSSR